MFLPSTASTAKSEKEKKRQIIDKIEGWAMALVPDDIRKSAQITVQEVQCGDPSCAPIDTLFTIMFER